MKNILVLWNDKPHIGTVSANDAVFHPGGKFCTERLELFFESAAIETGGIPTIVNIRCDKNPFSFILRDVTRKYPIYVPEYGVVVTEIGDTRSFKQIVDDIKSRNGRTKMQEIEAQDEYSFEKAAG